MDSIVKAKPVVSQEQFKDGAAFVRGEFVPLSQADISVRDWGFTHCDATYDVVHTWEGRFFRLNDHIDRFNESMASLRLTIPHTTEELKKILAQCVVLSGIQSAYVAMVCTRGRPVLPGSRRPKDCLNTFIAYAIPWIDVAPPSVQERGVHLWLAKTPRQSSASFDPRIKNYQWGDFTQGMFEADDRGFDTAMLMDADSFLTEGPGFNVFIVKNGCVYTPDRGVLEGITRRSVLELCERSGVKAAIAGLRRGDLENADEVFLSSTAGGIMPVSRVGDIKLSGDKPGPLTMRLKALYWAAHNEGWHGTRINYQSFDNPLGEAADGSRV